MYPDTVLIDALRIDGELTNFKIRPKSGGQLTVGGPQDTSFALTNADVWDAAGIRIYNFSECTVETLSDHIPEFKMADNGQAFSFRFRHMAVPVGPNRPNHFNIYNLVLPPGWRLLTLRLLDPYKLSKTFTYQAYWDTARKIQVVEMEMRSRRETFSFLIEGTASRDDEGGPSVVFLPASTGPWGFNSLEAPFLDREVRKHLVHQLLDYLVLEPNIAGIGVDLKKMLKDFFDRFLR